MLHIHTSVAVVRHLSFTVMCSLSARSPSFSAFSPPIFGPAAAEPKNNSTPHCRPSARPRRERQSQFLAPESVFYDAMKKGGGEGEGNSCSPVRARPSIRKPIEG